MDHVVDQKAYRGLTYVLYIFYLISSFTGGVSEPSWLILFI